MIPAEMWMLGIAGVLFAIAAVMAIIRIVIGPSIVDRVVASDTLATIVMCALIADMAIQGHTSTLPLVLGLAMGASIGTMAVARFVSRSQPTTGSGDESAVTPPVHPDHVAATDDPEATRTLAEEGLRDQGEFSDGDAVGHDGVKGVDIEDGDQSASAPHHMEPSDGREADNER